MTTDKIKRIALIGPESSGKTTLCQLLAEHYKTRWVPEYAREYIGKLSRTYTLNDLLNIAKEQLNIEEKKLAEAKKILFIDTELVVAKIWCEDVFKFCPDWIEEKIEEKKYDLYLLTKPDLPWKNDPVRENPNRREYFFNLYLNDLESRKFNYKIISGKGNERFKNAKNAIETFLKIN